MVLTDCAELVSGLLVSDAVQLLNQDAQSKPVQPKTKHCVLVCGSALSSTPLQRALLKTPLLKYKYTALVRGLESGLGETTGGRGLRPTLLRSCRPRLFQHMHFSDQTPPPDECARPRLLRTRPPGRNRGDTLRHAQCVVLTTAELPFRVTQNVGTDVNSGQNSVFHV